MKRLVAAICTGLLGGLGGLSASGCGSATQRESVAPDAASGATGTLVVRVAGHPRDIRYFIDGKHYEPDEEIEWWRDARLEVELEPGAYRVEAEYLVRAFAGEGETYRIATPEPVVVNAGQVTLLYARIEKDYRGVPKRETAVFSVLHPSSQADDDSPAPQGALEGGSPAVEGEAAGVRHHAVAPEEIWIRNGNVRFEAAPTWTPPAGRSIQVSGSRVTASNDPPVPHAVQRDENSTITIRRSTSHRASNQPARRRRRNRQRRRRICASAASVGAGVRRHPPASLRGDDAAVGSIRIRGTRVDESAAPAAPTSPQP